MKHMTFVALFIALVSLPWLAACGGGGGASSSNQEAESASESISVVMHDIYFGDRDDNQENPPLWTVTSGADVTVNLDNQGVLEHNWAIVKPGETIPDLFNEAEHSDILLFDSGRLAGDTQRTRTFTAPEPGEYVVICSVPGHYPMMQGRLVVE